jgi:N-acetylglucosamine repressor
MNPSLATLRPSQVGKLNERQVFRVIQAHGPLSRAQVARRSGLSAPTVSKAVASLAAAGLLEEVPAPGPARGRPAPLLRLASERAQVLGVVIDAGTCKVVAAGLDGVIHPDSDPTVTTPPTYAELLDAIADRCRKLTAKPGVATLGLGVSLPGLTDSRQGRGVLSPNVPITDGHRPAADLGERLGLPCVVLQESHALCLAERHYGLAVGLDDFAMLDVSTGVGLGVMSGGRLLTGHSGLAGEIGHITAVADGGRQCGCGNRGCLETVASDTALAWRVSRRLGRELTVDDVVELAKSGRAPIAKELQETARYVGVAVAAVVNLFNPSTVFVHSRAFEADAGLFDRIVEQARGRALPPSFADCRVVRAKGNKRQGAVAGIVQHLTNAVAPGLSHL